MAVAGTFSKSSVCKLPVKAVVGIVYAPTAGKTFVVENVMLSIEPKKLFSFAEREPIVTVAPPPNKKPCGAEPP